MIYLNYLVKFLLRGYFQISHLLILPLIYHIIKKEIIEQKLRIWDVVLG